MNSEFTIAVHSLVYLANVPGHMASSEQIASNVCTHPARIRKVMGFLRRGGYVDTKEGIGGGYCLTVSPEEIRLGAVYRLTSVGSIKPGWCSGDVTQHCVVSSNITDVMDALFDEAEGTLMAFFDAITIRMLLDRIRDRQLAGES